MAMQACLAVVALYVCPLQRSHAWQRMYSGAGLTRCDLFYHPTQTHPNLIPPQPQLTPPSPPYPSSLHPSSPHPRSSSTHHPPNPPRQPYLAPISRLSRAYLALISPVQPTSPALSNPFSIQSHPTPAHQFRPATRDHPSWKQTGRLWSQSEPRPVRK